MHHIDEAQCRVEDHNRQPKTTKTMTTTTQTNETPAGAPRTARRWAPCPYSVTNYNIHSPEVLDAKGRKIATAVCAPGEGLYRDDAEANAVFFARACNSHAALVALLPYALSRIEDMHASGGDNDPAWIDAAGKYETAIACLNA